MGNSADNTEQDSRHSHSPQAPILSFKCSEKQVNTLLETQATTDDSRTRKLSFQSSKNLPSFQESDEVRLKDTKSQSLDISSKDIDMHHIQSEPIKIRKMSEIPYMNNSDPARKQDTCPITIKVTGLEGSSENISPGSETQKAVMSRSLEDSRPRSLEMSGITHPSSGRESPVNKDDMSLASRSQSMEDGMDEDVFRRSHRLSLPGHSQRMTNYLKFLQELAVRQAMGGGLNSQLFSTAVISGSSSSPNLGPRNNCRVGEDGTPTIRPLETLHNALSLRQIDNFLDHVTSANFRPRNSSSCSKESEEKMES